MGGLRREMPMTLRTFLIGALAIAGIPPLAGFFSKDEILLGALRARATGSVLWAIGAGHRGADRLLHVPARCSSRSSASSARPRTRRTTSTSRPPSMTVPLVVLGGPVDRRRLDRACLEHLATGAPSSATRRSRRMLAAGHGEHARAPMRRAHGAARPRSRIGGARRWRTYFYGALAGAADVSLASVARAALARRVAARTSTGVDELYDARSCAAGLSRLARSLAAARRRRSIDGIVERRRRTRCAGRRRRCCGCCRPATCSTTRSCFLGGRRRPGRRTSWRGDGSSCTMAARWLIVPPARRRGRCSLFMPRAAERADQARGDRSSLLATSCSRSPLLVALRADGPRDFQFVEQLRVDPDARHPAITSASTASALLLVLLTTFLTPLVVLLGSWDVDPHAREGVLRVCCSLLETGMLGVVRRARPLPVLHLLGADARADVLPHRHLGRPAAHLRRDQVLPLHDGRQRADAGRDPAACYFQHRATSRRRARSTSTRCSTASSIPAAMQMLAVPRVRARLRDQGADVPVPHLAARRPRRGADRGLGDPGRRAAEDGHLRLPALRAAALPRGRDRAAPLHRGARRSSASSTARWSRWCRRT